MNKLFGVIILSTILSLLNQGYSYPIIEETDEEIIMQNSWVVVKLSKNTGGISSFIHWRPDIPYELLTDTAYITIKDKRNGKTYIQSEGKVVSVSTGGPTTGTVWAIFDINFPQDSAYTVKIKYTLDIQALRWDAKLQRNVNPDTAWEANIDFSFPAIANMNYAFWAKDGAPFQLPMTRTVTYRGRPVVLPALIQYNDTTDIGLSFVSPFEFRKPKLEWEMKNDSFIIANRYLRLSSSYPCSAAVYIIPHEADWRPGLAWIYDKYDSFFNPVSQTVLNGEGWHRIVDETSRRADFEYLRDYGVKWVEYFHFPFYGFYSPCPPNAPGKDTWMIITDTLQDITYNEWRDNFYDGIRRTGYLKNNKQDSLLRDTFGLQTYFYFQSFESWKQYAADFFPDQFAKGADLRALPAWEYCYLMNPDPDTSWGKYIISQIDTLLDKYPNVNGIFYDRDDYCDYDYNPLHNDDGVTMIGNKPVYMLGFAQEKINDIILDTVHNRGKGVWTNQPSCVEVCKNMDGIMSEDIVQAPYQQYLGITRPLILLPYDTTAQQAEEKLKTALYTGHFPSVTTYPDSFPESKLMDDRYKPLFSLYKGKKWVLYPHALQLPEGTKGNIFQSPAPDSDYLVPMIEPERYSSKVYPEPETTHDIFRYDRQAKIRIPDSLEIKYCYLLSGDYMGTNQDTIYKDSGLEIRVPAQRVSTLIQLSKEPRYEITRISSPVLTRGDSGKFEIKVHNIYEEPKDYNIQLITPFGEITANFFLDPGQTEKVGLGFMIEEDFPLVETTDTVIINDSTVVFTSWVVDILTFQLPEKPFIHSGKCGDTLTGDTIPFILVNNTNRKLIVSLNGSFVRGGGEVRFGTPPFESTQVVDLNSLEDTILVAYIAPDSEIDTVKIRAVVTAENDTVYAIRPVERTMRQEESALFHDDFSSGTMSNWDTVYGRWDASTYVAKDTGGSSHLARVEASSPDWDDYKFQVNTMFKGSIEPPVDWLRSLIYFRVQDTSNYYCFGFSGWSAGDELNLFKREGNKWSQLATYPLYPFKIKKDVWYNLKIEVLGAEGINNIKCFLDGNQLFNVTDTDTVLTSGGVGFGVLYESMRNYYDDVVVRSISE